MAQRTRIETRVLEDEDMRDQILLEMVKAVAMLKPGTKAFVLLVVNENGSLSGSSKGDAISTMKLAELAKKFIRDTTRVVDNLV